jgi:RNA polymerase sigma factor (sigma-70 family)
MPHTRVRAVVQEFQAWFRRGLSLGLTDGQLLERFTTLRGEAAESAFAALLERHGPMVLRACRDILRDEYDALDALQATFLTLALRGGSLWVRDSLGPWLHRVACRIAVRAKQSAGLRRAAERRAAEAAARSVGEETRNDLGAILHEEVNRLPERYRIPVILCDLEGRTYEEAARHLSCPVGTVKSRLARARERLRAHLSRRGIAAPAIVAGVAFCAREASAALPRGGWKPIALAILGAGKGGAEAVGAISDAAAALAAWASRSMMPAWWKWAAVAVVVGAVMLYGAGRPEMWPGEANRAADGAGRADERVAAGVPGHAGERKASEERNLPAFDEVRVTGKLQVVVTAGAKAGVTVSGDPGQVPALRTRVEKHGKQDRLLIDMNVPDGGQAAAKATGGIEVRVTTPVLLGATAEGGATVKIVGLRNKSLILRASDASKIEAAGSSDSVTAVIDDGGSLDASCLEARDVLVTAAGHSAGVILATDTLSAMLTGDARVEYVGAPPRINKVLSDRSTLTPRADPLRR